MFKKKDYMFVLENVSDPPNIECSLTTHSQLGPLMSGCNENKKVEKAIGLD